MTWWMKNPAASHPGVSYDPRTMKFHRKGQPDPKDLLDQLEATNLGNEFDINPAPLGNKGLSAFGNPQRVLNIEGQDKHSRLITVTLQQERTITNLFGSTPFGGFFQPVVIAGPLVGLVEFGAGGGRANAEFDIPTPTFGPGGIFNAAPSDQVFTPSSLLSNAIMLTLPASSIRVFVRNDSRVFPTNDPLGLVATSVPIGASSDPAKIRVHAAYGNGPVTSRLQRTYVLINSETFVLTAAACGIPPFARRVRFYRSDLTIPLDVSIRSQGLSASLAGLTRLRSTYTIPAGVDGSLELMPQDTSISVTPAAPGVTFLAAVFDVELP